MNFCGKRIIRHEKISFWEEDIKLDQIFGQDVAQPTMSVRPIKSSRTRAHQTSALKTTDQLRLQIHGKYMEDIWVIIKQEVYEERLMTRMNSSLSPKHLYTLKQTMKCRTKRFRISLSACAMLFVVFLRHPCTDGRDAMTFGNSTHIIYFLMSRSRRKIQLFYFCPDIR